MKKTLLLAFCCMFTAFAFAKTNKTYSSKIADVKSFAKHVSYFSKNKTKALFIKNTAIQVFFDCTAESSVTCGNITVTYTATAATCALAGAEAGRLADLTQCDS